MAEALTESSYQLAGGRTLERYCDTVAAGLQPTRKALPQLLPDGLPPDVHLQAALAVQHPLAYALTTTDPVRYALKNACEDLEETRNRRQKVVVLLRKLAAACMA